jgi:hypothetical protein
MANTINLNRKNTYITIWLYLSLFLVFLLIFIGGLTRLTESGLSITSWELFSGILPPLNEKQFKNLNQNAYVGPFSVKLDDIFFLSIYDKEWEVVCDPDKALMIKYEPVTFAEYYRLIRSEKDLT